MARNRPPRCSSSSFFSRPNAPPGLFPINPEEPYERLPSRRSDVVGALVAVSEVDDVTGGTLSRAGRCSELPLLVALSSCGRGIASST